MRVYDKLSDNEIIELYPWLNDFGYPLIRDIPEGWQYAFGFALCEELDALLIKKGIRDTYHISQIKEKYGELCWYDNCSDKDVTALIEKYVVISQCICVSCGRPEVALITSGWVEPLCESCYIREGGKSRYYPKKINQLPSKYKITSFTAECGKREEIYSCEKISKELKDKWIKLNPESEKRKK